MMSDKLLLLLEPSKQKHSKRIVSSIKFETVLTTLEREFCNGSKNGIILLTAVFSGLDETTDGFEKRISIIKKIFYLSSQNNIDTKVLTDLVGFLVMEIKTFPIEELIDLMDYFMEQIKSGNAGNSKSMELFPKVLSVISAHEKVPTKEDGVLTGEEYQEVVIKRICNLKWSDSNVVSMVTMIRDCSLKKVQLDPILDKIKKLFYQIPLEEVPSLVYQTLLLSVKGCKQKVLDAILTFFAEKSTSMSNEGDEEEEDHLSNLLQEDNINKDEDMRSVEGTTLLHVIFAMRRDQELGREFIKYVKGQGQEFPQKLVSPFTIALMLSMTQIYRMEEQVLDFLKSFVLKVFKNNDHQKESKWIRDVFPEKVPIEKSLFETTKNSKSGWDHVIQGLINLSFLLIGSYQPKPNDIFSITSDPSTPSQRACIIGAKIIQDIFKCQDVFRETILQQLLDTIITKRTVHQQQYLDLLTSIVSSVPQVVLDHLAKFREVFDYIPMLKMQTAEGLLRAVLPLMRVSMTIKDSIIMVFRKSMFSKNLESKKIAVMGFLLILKHFKIESDNQYSISSQVGCSQTFSCSQMDVPRDGRKSLKLWLQSLGTLRKSLTQDSSVRQQVYEGIYEVSCKNPKLSHAVLQLLNNQFLKYYERVEDQIPPIKLEECVAVSSDNTILIEPLDYLICVLQLCTKKSGQRLDQHENEDETLSHLLDDAEESLDSLTKRMAKCDLEDFNLDKTADFQSSSKDASKNIIFANIVLGIYEVLIEYNFMKETRVSESCCEVIQQLFDKHQALTDVLLEKQSGGKKNKSLQTKRSCLMSFKSNTKILVAILSNNVIEEQTSLNILRQSNSLAKFLATSVTTKLQQLVTSRYCDGAGGKNLEHLFRQCLLLSRTFLEYINGETMISEAVPKKDKGKKLGIICLEGLNHIIGFVASHLPNELKTLLESLDFHPDVVSQNSNSEGSLVYRVCRRVQRLIVKIITSPDEDLGLREAQVLLTMFSHLTPHLEHDDEIAHVYTWLFRLCAENNVDDLMLVKTIMSKYLSLHHRHKGTLGAICKICQDIHSRAGDIDEDIEVESSSNFQIINERNATPTVFLLACQHLEHTLDEMEFALNKLKTARCDGEGAREKQTKICQSLIGIVYSLHELVQTAFSTGPCEDLITKVVTKLYTILGHLTKYFVTQYVQSKTKVVEKFEKLVKLTGTHLAQQVYAVISYMQSTHAQNVHEQTLNTTTKTKDKKKNNRANKIRAMKDSKSIPNLIYHIEEFERFLIQLSKKTKTDYMLGMKRSTARDFRINAASLEAALQDVESYEDNDVSEVLDITMDDNDDNDEKIERPPPQSPKKKRKRLSPDVSVTSSIHKSIRQ